MSTGLLMTEGADRRLAVVAGLGVAVAISAVAARSLGALPSSAAAGLALVGAVIGLRVALIFAARSPSSPSRTRIMTTVSTVGLCISAVTLVASLPRVTAVGGLGKLLADLLGHLWVLALLTAVAWPVRTLGWRAFAGAGLVGFLAVPALARVVGTPVVSRLRTDSLFATALYAPLTEEVLKLLPALVVVLLALRRTQVRPAALDLLLLGAWTGAGFALYENALFGRGGTDWSANPPFSVLLPTQFRAQVSHGSIVVGGHLVYTSLVAVGVAFGLLYRRRFGWAWLAAPVAFVVVLGEHIAVNALPLLSPSGSESVLERILRPLTLGGRLSSLLLILAVAGVAVLEYRAVQGPGRADPRAFLNPAEAHRRSSCLARAQQPPAPTAVASSDTPVTAGGLG